MLTAAVDFSLLRWPGCDCVASQPWRPCQQVACNVKPMCDVLQGSARVVYHTRLEELLFGMSYVAPSAAEADEGPEE